MEKKNESPKLEINSVELTAITHYYRGEIDRMNTWRTRLDVTTNWAIITTAAFLSFGFGSKEITHFVIILATVFVFCFLFIEARRYKYYDLWRWRVALLNENFFARVLSPENPPLRDNWRRVLCDELQHSKFKITFLEAFGRRLRRNYSWIFVILVVCWFTKISIHPYPIDNIYQIIDRAAVFHLIPGWIIILAGILFNGSLIFIAFYTIKQRTEVVTIEPSERSKFKLPNV